MKMTEAIFSNVRNNFHTYVPAHVEPKTIGIIGGHGAMGQLLAREFHKDGYRVLVTGENPASYATGRALLKLNRNLVKQSDVIVFAVPVPVIGKGVHKLLGGNHHRGLRGKLFLDITSTKVASLQAMAKIPGATIIGTHPMFGSNVKNFNGLNVFITPLRRNHYILDARMEKWLEWVETFWKKRGAVVRRISAKEHDEVTPLVQGGVYLAVSLYAATLQAARADLRRVRDIATPNSTLLTALMGRMIRETSADIYLNLLLENENNIVLADLRAEHASRIATMLKNKDREGMTKFIQGLCDFQPDDFKKWGMDLTNHIQDEIAKRSECKQ